MKKRKQAKIHHVDVALYPESPLLEVSQVWLLIDDKWYNQKLEPVDPLSYKDHLNYSYRQDATTLVNELVRENEARWHADCKRYHRRLWHLASVLIDEMD